MAYLLKLSQLKKFTRTHVVDGVITRKRGFVVEYRYPSLKRFGLKACSPEYHNRLWRTWSEAPTDEEREQAIWHESETICAICRKACGGCKWSDKLEPVDGWDATVTYDDDGETPFSYEVHDCPEFIPGRRPGTRLEDLNDEGCTALMERMMELAQDDYINNIDQVHIKEWIRNSQWIADPEDVIKELERERVEEMNARQSLKAASKKIEELEAKLEETNTVLTRAMSDIKRYNKCIDSMITGGSPCVYCEDQDACKLQAKTDGKGCEQWWLAYKEGNDESQVGDQGTDEAGRAAGGVGGGIIGIGPSGAEVSEGVVPDKPNSRG